MRIIDEKTIEQLISLIREQVTVSAGDGDNTRILIKPGFKLSHKDTGIEYTVHKVFQGDDGLLIKCTRPPNISITVTGDELDKEFEKA